MREKTGRLCWETNKGEWRVTEKGGGAIAALGKLKRFSLSGSERSQKWRKGVVEEEGCRNVYVRYAREESRRLLSTLVLLFDLLANKESFVRVKRSAKIPSWT